MNLQAYLDRIEYTGTTEPTFATLVQLHRHHLFHIPFENLNIHIPRRIVLDDTLLFEKIVNEKRGGFCFEQNGLFHAVLKHLGFDVTRLEANVHNEGEYGIPMNHMALMVTIEGVRYLADVGFGASFLEPLEIDNPNVQVHDNMEFKIVLEGDTAYYHNRIIGRDAMDIGYRFFFEPYTLADYAEACEYMQTSSKTHFTQKRVCSRWSEQGRLTLSDAKFVTTTWAGERTEMPVKDDDHFHELLREHFGITVVTQPPQRKAKTPLE